MGVIENLNIDIQDLNTIRTLFRQYLPETRIWAYGSRVNQSGWECSDLDIVVFTSPEQQDAVFDLRIAIEEALLPFRIDLHCWDDLPERFQKNIEQHYVVLQDAPD